MNDRLMTDMFNGTSVPLSRMPLVRIEALLEASAAAVQDDRRLVGLFAAEHPEGLVLYVILADDRDGGLSVGRARLDADSYPALTPRCAQAHGFEREVAEQYGIKPLGHPWLKPLRYARGMRGAAPAGPVGTGDFFQVDGEGVHEVAVGPVHAGVIEPGHFRFQCHGETVFFLEIALGYQHRGIEAMARGGPHRATGVQMETVAGDTSIGHMLAYSQLVEALGGTQVPARAMAMRGIALELERLANHTGDLGALANDIAFLPTASYCGRLRGDFLNMTAGICGNRFGRGMLVPGGVGFDIAGDGVERLRGLLDHAFAETKSAVELLFSTASVLARFENTGTLSPDAAQEIGLVGMAARACGLTRDVRRDHPAGIYQYAYIPVITASTGDVYARALVRGREIEKSVQFIQGQLAKLPAGPAKVSMRPLEPNAFALTMTEGWRGEIVHVGITDDTGRFLRYKIIDPSFHNWFGLSLALRNQQISDFPLINKSFNLSYCGHDL